MKKGQRPSKHYRIVRTKKGKHKIIINKAIKKKLKFKKKGTIKIPERKIFTHLSNPRVYSKEFGGAIDFDLKGQVENINVMPGAEYDVSIPPDYEVQYHTHPDKDVSPPTPEDIMALLSNKNQQAEVIFRNGQAFTIIKTPLTKALSKLPTTQKNRMLDKAFLSSIGSDWETKWKKKLEEMGFLVYIDRNTKKAMDIKIKPIEPKRGRR